METQSDSPAPVSNVPPRPPAPPYPPRVARAEIPAEKTPRKARTPRKTVDLAAATTKTADGALKPVRSVYAMCGVSENNYRSVSKAQYSINLAGMNLIELQDEAYEHGVPATDNRETMIDRLERKYISEINKFGFAPTAAEPETPDKIQRDKALAILAKGR